MRPLQEVLDMIRARDNDNARKQDGDGFLSFVAQVHFDDVPFFYPLVECEGCLRELSRLAEKHEDATVRELAEALIHYKDRNKKE